MPAPKKKGLDYFPFGVDLLDDPKLIKPRMKYGSLAPYIYICLLKILYKDEGYFIDFRNKEIVLWQLLNYCQGGNYTVKQETVEGVIDILVACELFSGDLYRLGIITSRRAQATYYSATVDRKTVDIDENIWLLTIEEMKSLSAKHCYYLKSVNRPNNSINRPNNGVNRPNNPQSKVQYIKEEYSTTTTKESKGKASGGCGCYKSSISLFEEIKTAPLNEYEITRLAEIVDEYGEKWTLEALRVMADAGKCRIDYVNGILRNWKTNGRSAKPKSFKERKEEERQKMIDEWLKEESEVAENAQSGIDEAL